MEPVQIKSLDKPLDIRFTGKRMIVPARIKTKIDEYWKKLRQRNPKLHNGEVFTIQTMREDTDAIHLHLAETDYAHYLYSRQIGDLGKYAVKIIHPAALVMVGGDMIFGRMGRHTSLAGIIQCCGGGIDHAAIDQDGVVAIEETIATELKEELGIDVPSQRVKSITPVYLKTGGSIHQMTLIFIVELSENSQQFLSSYETFAASLRAKSEDPEFEELFCITSDTKKVDAFIREHEPNLAEYMPTLLRAAAR